MTKKHCRICKKLFLAISSNHLYCDDCRFIKCPVCKKIFIVKPKSKTIQKFCSKECFTKFQTGRIIPRDIVERMAEGHRGRKTGKFINCLQCQKRVYKYPRDLKYSRIFCSFKCFHKYLSKNASPKRNNKTKEKNWKKQIYKNDNYTCQICGYKGGKIEAHHLKEWSKFPKLRFKISNGITLCQFCHKTYANYWKLGT